MYAIEFQAPIQGGGIKIPEHYLPKLHGNVKVIIFTEYEATTTPDIIDRLMEFPLPVTDSKPLSREEIYESRT